MKIQCDVCGSEEASVFCTADEAALCRSCDDRVHGANKLAGKHPRFSLLNPQIKDDSQLCDICQERRALMFCQEDRAMFCRECDVPIHRVNELTRKHNRFLLTGIKLSTEAPPSSCQVASASASASCSSSRSRIIMSHSETETPTSASMDVAPDPPTANCYSNTWRDDNNTQSGLDHSTSTISEYFMDEKLPGWHFEDFLDPSDHDYGFY
ncbi:B-box zinc finger protein 20-like isoform X2 [Andrographis paniculata]|uniref:B-box zinc finger protein 20-like isoform X2 n=1 Tax=Andrographis paniculata TaxID=175694 RepID=UPI0021E7F2D5|nr:B-box zinc finger protein 20-like isoform X2 [Andrographis paniculata]